MVEGDERFILHHQHAANGVARRTCPVSRPVPGGVVPSDSPEKHLLSCPVSAMQPTNAAPRRRVAPGRGFAVHMDGAMAPFIILHMPP